MFEDLGFKYLGPVDGHNINDIRTVLKRAKEVNEPVLVHINTKKGKGYLPAEKSPDYFHGVQRFDGKTGMPLGKASQSWSDYFGETLCSIAEKNDNVVAITAAMPAGTGLTEFAKRFPDRFFDVAISEQHAVTFSAGLALDKMVPVVAIYSTFLQRAYDQIIHDVSLMKLHVVFCIDRCGIVGSDGETHQGMYDIAYMSMIPYMTILSPSNKKDFELMLDFAINKGEGPVAIRYPRGSIQEIETEATDVRKSRLLKEGTDILIAAVGICVYDAMAAAEILEKDGISVAVADVRCIKPIDEEFMRENAQNKKMIVSIEDAAEKGGFGQQLEVLLGKPVLRLAYPDEPIHQGSVEQIKYKYSMSPGKIAERIKSNIKTK